MSDLDFAIKTGLVYTVDGKIFHTHCGRNIRHWTSSEAVLSCESCGPQVARARHRTARTATRDLPESLKRRRDIEAIRRKREERAENPPPEPAGFRKATAIRDPAVGLPKYLREKYWANQADSLAVPHDLRDAIAARRQAPTGVQQE